MFRGVIVTDAGYPFCQHSNCVAPSVWRVVATRFVLLKVLERRAFKIHLTLLVVDDPFGRAAAHYRWPLGFVPTGTVIEGGVHDFAVRPAATIATFFPGYPFPALFLFLTTSTT